MKKISRNTPALLKATPITARRSRRPLLAVLAAGAVLLILAAMWAFLATGRAAKSVPAAEQVPAWKTPPVLLVCDFMNAGRNPDITWMESAVADMSITDLAQCPYLKVISRREMAEALERLVIDPDRMAEYADALAAELGADLVLTGAIVKLGTSIRIDLQLQEAATGRILAAQDATEPEETFLNAIDNLSGSLRKRVAQLIREHGGTGPDLTAAHAVDLTLAEQLFPALPAEAEVPADTDQVQRVRKSKAENKRALADAGPPDGSASEDLPDESASAGAPPAPALAAERAAKSLGSERHLDKGQEGAGVDEMKNKNFRALRCYYQAVMRLKRDRSPEAVREAIANLDEALSLIPSFQNARQLRDTLTPP